jgi:hypothetical protein
MLKKNKNKFYYCKEKEGIHSYRIFNIAVVDVLLTIVVCFAISAIFKTNIFVTIIIAFLIGILAHRIFCVNTTVNKMIFGEL